MLLLNFANGDAATHISESKEANRPNIKKFLIEQNILPTAEKAKNIFWTLGDHWWKQIIDGKYHKYGKKVFDGGLHKGPTEPGFLAGIEAGSGHFTQHLDEELSVKLYRDIHHAACAHFNGASNEVLCDASEIDFFRSKEEYCSTVNEKHVEFLKKIKSFCEEFFVDNGLLSWIAGLVLTNNKNIINFIKTINNLYKIKIDNHKDLLEFVNEKIELYRTDEVVNCLQKVILLAETKKTQLRINVKRFVDFEYGKHTFVATYLPTKPEKIQLVVEKLFSEFNQNIELRQNECYANIVNLSTQDIQNQLKTIKTVYQDKALNLIARLFAELEWAHPWIDGQGRTDLILLNGLLCREGLHPCILYEPYFSSFNTIEAWIDNLKVGLKNFEEEMKK